MQNFTFYLPTEIVFGRATEFCVGQEVRKHGGTKVLLVYGGRSAKESGLLDYTSGVVRGFAYPKGVDPQITEKMLDAMRNVMNSDSYQEAMANLDLIPTPMEPDELYEMLDSQLDDRLAVYGLERKDA